MDLVSWGKNVRNSVHDLIKSINQAGDYINNTLPGLLNNKANVSDIPTVPHIEHGITSTSGAAGVFRTVQVNFKTPFENEPSIVATLRTTNPDNGTISISAPSKTGFTIQVKYATASDIPVHWIATD